MKKHLLALMVIALCGCPATPKVVQVQNGDIVVTDNLPLYAYQPDRRQRFARNNPVDPAPARQPDDGSLAADDPRSIDQSTEEYVKEGYDYEVFPRKDPKHFTF